MSGRVYGDVEVVATTDKAIKVKSDELGERWLPRSVITSESEIDTDAEEGDVGDLVVKEWFADNEGWPS